MYVPVKRGGGGEGEREREDKNIAILHHKHYKVLYHLKLLFTNQDSSIDKQIFGFSFCCCGRGRGEAGVKER